MPLTIERNIAKVRQRIREAEQKFLRKPNSVQLMAVSKTRSPDMIRQAVHSGIVHFGENYLQEALDKQAQLQDLTLTWHFIGPIQSNKTKLIAEHFDWVHSVDRLKIAQRLNDQRPDALSPLNICLQVNISNETSKSGCAIEALPELATQIDKLPRLRLQGLMAIPRSNFDQGEQRKQFAAVATALKHLKYPGLKTLSMGMSADLEAAIAEGATIVRVGTDVFGPRNG